MGSLVNKVHALNCTDDGECPTRTTHLLVFDAGYLTLLLPIYALDVDLFEIIQFCLRFTLIFSDES
jgi:hypothetical protein